jgi:hypothetical protein
MSRAARLVCGLIPRNALAPASPKVLQRTPVRLQALHHQLELLRRPPLAPFRPFTLSARLREDHSRDIQDGLRNNRDHSATVTPAAANVSQTDAKLLSDLVAASTPRPDVPSYQMIFTCKKCDERSAHTISKQGYHHGTVLVTCPGCKNRHLVSDHLKVLRPDHAIRDLLLTICQIFSDTSVTIEDILREKGDKLNKLAINKGGDFEFWDEAQQPPE